MAGSGTGREVPLRVLGRRVDLRVPEWYAATAAAQWARCLDPTEPRPVDPRPVDPRPADPRPAGAAAYAPTGEEAATPVVAVPDTGVGDPAYGYAVQSAVTLEAIRVATGGLLLWHAAALAAPDGRVCGLVGPSGAGKTTAVRHLAGRGYGYVTDETLGVTPDGLVLPYPKPLALAGSGAAKTSVGPDELGLGRVTGPLRLHRLVRLVRDPRDPRDPPEAPRTGGTDAPDAPDAAGGVGPADDASGGAGRAGGGRPRLERVPLVDAVLHLVAESSGLLALAEPLALVARTLERTGGLLDLHYGEIDEATGPLERLLADAGPAAAVEGWRHVGGDPGPGYAPVAAPVARTGEPTIRRAPWRDAIEVADELIVLVGAVPLRLSGIGVTIWLALDVARTPSELVESLRRAHGPHARAEALTGRAVAELVAAGALVRDPAPSSRVQGSAAPG